MKKKISLLILLGLFLTNKGFSQAAPDYNGGFKVNLSEDGKKQLRILSWAQFWAQHDGDKANDAFGNENADLDFSIRRARILSYAKINNDFLIVTHFGLNSMNANNMHPTGKGDGSQLFFHDVWGQYNLNEDHSVGGGLHYWNGISRLNNQSTLNMLPMDNNRQAWATIGLTDQFARHMGIYAKGKFDKLQYRVAINEAIRSSLDVNVPTENKATYNGRALLGSKEAGKNFAAYVDYNLLDQESNFLPYKVGTYLGKKKVLNVGAGVFHHPNGSAIVENGNITGENVTILGADVFYDAPVGGGNGAITAYGLFQNNNYGENYTLGQTYATGNMVYGQLGYAIPGNSKVRVQPYTSLNNRSIDAIDDNATDFGLGSNFYLNGNNSKLTLDYKNTKYGDNDANGVVTLQAMIYL